MWFWFFTTEGLYLARISNSKFALLDSYQSFVDSRALIKKIIICNIFLSKLKNFSLLENEFLRIKDFKGNELVLFTSNGQVYKPKCVKIDKIILVDSELCYKDIPIKFYVSGFWKNGYLTNDKIIQAVALDYGNIIWRLWRHNRMTRKNPDQPKNAMERMCVNHKEN